MTEYIEKQWREVTSRNPVDGQNFKTGLKDFKFSVDATMMSARSYGPFTNFGQGTVPPSGAMEMVLCVDADGPSGREHTLQY
jgi:hypothetical protein